MFQTKNAPSSRELPNPLLSAFGLSAALIAAGCSTTTKPPSESDSTSIKTSQQTIETPRSPVPAGESFCSYLDGLTEQLHTESRGTAFVRSYKEKYMSREQYISNLIQRHVILEVAMKDIEKYPEVQAILGAETMNFRRHIEQDLAALGRPVSSIKDGDILNITKDCISYIRTISPQARISVAHIYVGGAANGGKYIGKGIQNCLGIETPVAAFTQSPHETIEAFEARLNAIGAEHHQSIIDAELELFSRFNQINSDNAYAQKS